MTALKVIQSERNLQPLSSDPRKLPSLFPGVNGEYTALVISAAIPVVMREANLWTRKHREKEKAKKSAEIADFLIQQVLF